MNFISQWLIVVLSTVLLMACESNVRETSQKRFMRMVNDQEVDRITIVNDQLVEVRLKPDVLASRKYRGVLGDKTLVETGKPHFQVMITSEQAFRDDLAKMNPGFPITTEKRGLFGFTQ